MDMDPKLEKKNKILNYSIVASCIILLFLVSLVFSNVGVYSIMGNSVYTANGKYETGEIVEYANTNWYVISENNKSYTLLRQNSLSEEEIKSLNLNIYVGTNGEVAYDSGTDCYADNTIGCSTSLENSTIGMVLTAYQNNKLKIDDLITIDDYTIRLINMDDINNLKSYNWLKLNQYYWTMSSPNYSNLNIFGLNNDGQTYIHMVYDGSNEELGGLVRPVINVKKVRVK